MKKLLQKVQKHIALIYWHKTIRKQLEMIIRNRNSLIIRDYSYFSEKRNDN